MNTNTKRLYRIGVSIFVVAGLCGAAVLGCSGVGESSSSSTTSTATCTSPEPYTTGTSTYNSLGCELLTRDTSSCQSSRTAQGISGYWLNMSCRVTLTKSGSSIYMVANGVPDHKSYYFGASSSCYETYNTDGGSRSPNPNSIATQSITMEAPYSPSENLGTKTDTELGAVGIAVNGVPIFNNEAGPMDNIYDESLTFDSCEGHPASTTYHYHIEPPTVSSSDNAFIGIARDGFPIYGLYDSGSTLDSALDTNGGHTGNLPDDAGTSMYHYHLKNIAGTDGSSNPASAVFIKFQSYHGNIGSTCTNCLP